MQITPGHGLAHLNPANACLLQKQYDLAVTRYKEALDINPDDAEARRNLERARAALGNQ